MGWLPITVLLAVGILALALVAVGTLAAVNRVRRASRTLNVAVAGRSSRLLAGIAELNAWRDARRPATGARTAGVSPGSGEPDSRETGAYHEADGPVTARGRERCRTDEAAEGNTA